ncbi:sexual differentiation process protein isp4 [Diaporthe helianthi]|uniref:Sexual differentiation process protein isp4 n=1 Tax=Diaporthe helianthi TaxID=158607 RepID=A0A2P5IF66_DIAHE|nr:sexual differentiation process protein isp4 [Diaporthe helianthi]
MTHQGGTHTEGIPGFGSGFDSDSDPRATAAAGQTQPQLHSIPIPLRRLPGSSSHRPTPSHADRPRQRHTPALSQQRHNPLPAVSDPPSHPSSNVKTEPSSAPASPDVSLDLSHGTDTDSAQSGGDTANESSNVAARPSDQLPMQLLNKAPPFLRSSPGFRSPSYGAVQLGSAGDTPAVSESSNDAGEGSSDGDNRGGDTHTTTTSAAAKSHSSLRKSVSRARLARSSEELASSTVTGGIEGRYGVTESSLASDVLADPKGSGSEDEEDDSVGISIPPDRDEDPPDNSPYPQVRASVAPYDNTTLSISTPRMWTLSVLFSILGSSTNLFFSLRYPSVSITPVIALLLVHPLGLLWDLTLKRRDDPLEEFIDGNLSAGIGSPTVPSSEDDPGRNSKPRTRLGRLRLWLAQGRWNEKEHACVYVSSNVSFGFAFATDVIVEQTQFYKQDASIVYQLLLTLSTQILGYAFAGLTRRFLVRPSGMIWPSTLMSAAMFTTLHKEENKPANGWRISRWNFFYVVWTVSFLFYFFPGLLMPCLSYFNVLTWFAPKNVVVANLFGVTSGLGLFPVTFDWAQIAYIGSPLLTPFWAAMNVVGGLVLVMWIMAPIAYYSNWLYSSYMPILSAAVFDNTGKVYDVSKILTQDFLFDKEAYKNYSRVFLPITYVLSYGVQFAGLAALLTHTACWHGHDIWTQWTRSLEEAKGESKTAYQPLATEPGDSTSQRPTENGVRQRRSMSMSNSNSGLEGLMNREDVHNRLMKRYKDAPISWYMITFVTMLVVGIFVVEYYPIHLPWYGLLLALGICSILFIPIGIIMAVTNQHSSIYLICQLVCGAVFPGRPVANMVFVTYGYISSSQGIKFAADLKLGHYMKIPPRTLFWVQMVATIISSLTQIGVLNWMFVNVPGICTPEAINGFTCPLARVHFNGSILWGVVGPAEFFGPNATYRPLVWCFLLGAVAPIPLYFYSRNKKKSIVRKINLPVLFGSLSWIPPATGLNFSVWAVVCYFFNYLIKNRAQAWWAKYTMTLSAALDSGLAFGIVVVFFGLIYPGWTKNFSWWGTEVYKQGCDWQACAYNTVPEGGRFGPEKW